MAYCLALGAIGEDVIVPRHSDDLDRFKAEPAVERMVRSTTVVADPELNHYHESVVVLNDRRGSEIARKDNGAPKGSPQNPMTENEVWQKFRRMTNRFDDRVDLARYIERLHRLDTATTCEWIMGSFATEPSVPSTSR